MISFFSSQRGQIIENISQATDSKYTYSKEQSDLDSNLKTNLGYQRANKEGKKSLHNIQLPLVSQGIGFKTLPDNQNLRTSSPSNKML